MIDWYVPIAILPGVGLLLTSTASIANFLGSEISLLIKEDHVREKNIIERKIAQLGLINRSMVGFYVTAACFVLGGLIGGISQTGVIHLESPMLVFLLFGTCSTLYSLILLTIYSYRAVQIKRQQFQQKI